MCGYNSCPEFVVLLTTQTTVQVVRYRCLISPLNLVVKRFICAPVSVIQTLHVRTAHCNSIESIAPLCYSELGWKATLYVTFSYLSYAQVSITFLALFRKLIRIIRIYVKNIRQNTRIALPLTRFVKNKSRAI